MKIVSMLGLLFTAGLGQLAQAQITPDCQKFINALPPTAIHGFIRVPEDWLQPTGKQIQVFYFGYHFQENPGVSPLVFFNGGPGSSAQGMDAYLNPKPEYHKVPFLYIDQRGTGCSSPLPPMEFTRRGVQETGFYGARSIVYDAESIRLHVFHGKPWRVFGQSYGGFIVHRYVELAPHALLAAFSHGAAIMTDSIEWTAMRARAFKRVGDEYFKDYPADREIVNRARTIFPKNYCANTPEYQICGAPLMDDMGWGTLSFKDFGYWKKLHEQIVQLLLPTGELNMNYIKTRFPSSTKSDPGVLLVDVVPAREAPGGFCNTWSCELAIPRMEARGEHPMDYEFNECRNALAIDRHFDYRLVKEVVAQDYVSFPRIVNQLRTHPALKFFLYSAHLDTFGPEETFLQEAQTLGRRIQYRPYASGHGSYFEEKQTWLDILSTQ